MLQERFRNNYDFLRLFAAFCIICYHSFSLTGKSIEEPLSELTAGRIYFSFIGLSIFFCISGYLIAKSVVHSPNLINYLWKRLLRIQPLLLVLCLLTIFILGPIFSDLPLSRYFLNAYTYTYCRNIIPVFGIQFTLPGVFVHLHDKGVNGSLWTLIIEERLYLLMALLFLFKKNKARYFILLIVLVNVIYFVNRYMFLGEMIPYFSGIPFFYALLFINSALLYFLKCKFSKNQFAFVTIGFLLFLTGTFFPKADILYFFGLPVLINALAHIRGKLNYTGKYGDFTFGTYIFSFPVQQILVSKGVESPYFLLALTLIIVIPMAVLSWNFIEKPALKLKHLVKSH